MNNQKFSNIKIVFVDWYKTLSFSNFWNHFYYDGRKSIYDKINQSLYVKPGIDLINNWMRGDLDYNYILNKVSKDIGESRDFLKEELVRSCKNLDVCKESLNLIQKIREKGIKVVLASDNMDIFRKYTVPALKLEQYFDDFLLSNELGCLKGDSYEVLSNKGALGIDNGGSPFFGNFLQNTGVKYNQTVLIDDSLPNSVNEKYGINYLRVGNVENSRAVDYLKLFANDSIK